jgi:SagB-type dehydrogenase family enzyme
MTAAHLSAGWAYLPIGEGPPDLSGVDWDSAPTPFKQYSTAPRIALPFEKGEIPILELLGLFFKETAGLTRQRYRPPEPDSDATRLEQVKLPTRQLPDVLRSIPSGGGLHPYELYLISTRDAHLEDGIYHYNALEHSLERLIEGDTSAALAAASSANEVSSRTLVITCCFSRNSFKYRDFGYRVQSIDLGIVLGQARAAATRHGWTSLVRYRFDDDALDHLLGLDERAEAAYAILEFGEPRVIQQKERITPRLPQADSRSPLPFDAWTHLANLHHAARQQPRSRDLVELPISKVKDQPLIELPTVDATKISLETIWQRQSAMHAFAQQTLSLSEAAKLFRAASSYDNDSIKPDSHSVLYAMINAVSGLKRGIYRYHPRPHALELLRETDARVDLHNTLGGPSQNPFELSLAFFPVGHFHGGLKTYGDRWYRVQNMDAGIVVARLYRAASALGLGCHANLNYKLREANRALELPEPWTTLIQVLVGGVAVNGRKLDMPLIAQRGVQR